MEHVFKGKRARGRLKAQPEDFVVEEITKGGAVLESGRTYAPGDIGIQAAGAGAKFTVFVMQKRNWNTAQALREVAKRVGRGIRSSGFAGTKDRFAVTTQLCSIFGASPEAVQSVHVKDISINGAWASDAQVRMGDLAGNRFMVVVREVDDAKPVEDALSALGGRFPNYFGPQRFGIRGNNASVGALMLRQEFEAAVRAYLTDTSNETNASAVDARKRLAEEWDFGRALAYFPQHLKYERAVIEYLSRFPGNYANALRKLPRSILLMFVHAVEAEIFNAELESRVRAGALAPASGDTVCPSDKLGFPDYSAMRSFDGTADGTFIVGSIVGYDTEPNLLEHEILDSMNLTTEMFKVRGMPELNAKGAPRALFAPYVGMESSGNGSSISLRFSLPAGSYATSLLAELADSNTNDAEDSSG